MNYQEVKTKWTIGQTFHTSANKYATLVEIEPWRETLKFKLKIKHPRDWFVWVFDSGNTLESLCNGDYKVWFPDN